MSQWATAAYALRRLAARQGVPQAGPSVSAAVAGAGPLSGHVQHAISEDVDRGMYVL